MTAKKIDHRFSVAPMLDWTDRHCRYFLRLLSPNTVLYTEMVTTGAIIFGKGDYLSFNDEEHPLVLQLGGSNPADLARCAEIAQQKGYDEINLNVGCPSDRVQNGRFGACLMAEPKLVAECVTSMKSACDLPITVKSRIGIDEQDSYGFLSNFIHIVSTAGCEHFIIHARKAWLSGLSPKQNREVPPLDYSRVYKIKQDFSQLQISINGGIKSSDDVISHLKNVDGVMIGREIYQNPFILNELEKRLWPMQSDEGVTRENVVSEMIAYVNRHVASGGKPWHVYRHMLGLCNGLPGGKKFRRYLSENSSKAGASGNVLADAFSLVSV